MGGNTSDINLDAFSECTSLESIQVAENNAFYSSKDGMLFNKKQTEILYCPVAITGTIEIPDTVTKIGEETFCDCKKIEQVILGANVEEISEAAFYRCSNLKSIELPNGLKTIGRDAFSSCQSLKELTIPASVISLDRSAIEYCQNMEAIHVEDGNTLYSSIDGILYNKEQDKVVLCPMGWRKTTYKTPASVTTIGQKAFAYSNLINVELTEGVTTVEDDAFRSCNEIEKLTLPASLSKVGYRAFYEPMSMGSYVDTTGIHSIYYLGTTKQWDELMNSSYNLC